MRRLAVTRTPFEMLTTEISRRITLLLTHPVTMVVKRRVADVFWALNGKRIHNPLLPPASGSLLFICKGNICRSPFAARFAARLLQAAGRPDVLCRSAGFSATPGSRSPVEAVAAAEAFGVALDDHEAEALTGGMIDEADVVVVFEASHLARLRRSWPHRRDRFVLLPLCAPGSRRPAERYNIFDPFGKPRQVYDACYGRIEAALGRLIDALLSRGRPVADEESAATPASSSRACQRPSEACSPSPPRAGAL